MVPWPALLNPSSIDHRTILDEPEQTRPRIAGLRQWRHGTNFDETEPLTQHCSRHFGIFVEAGREPYRVDKIEAEQPDCQAGVGNWRST